MKKILKSILWLMTVFSWCVLPAFSFAQNEVPPGISRQEEVPGKGLHKGWQQGMHKGWTKQELMRLRKEDPEEFRDTVKNKRSEIIARLERLKQADPERYRKVMQRIRQMRFTRLQGLRREDPKKFQEAMQARKKRFQERLERLKTEDPEKYQRIIQFRDKFKGLRKPRKEDPGKFKKYLKEHPETGKQIQDLLGKPPR